MGAERDLSVISLLFDNESGQGGAVTGFSGPGGTTVSIGGPGLGIGGLWRRRRFRHDKHLSFKASVTPTYSMVPGWQTALCLHLGPGYWLCRCRTQSENGSLYPIIVDTWPMGGRPDCGARVALGIGRIF